MKLYYYSTLDCDCGVPYEIEMNTVPGRGRAELLLLVHCPKCELHDEVLMHHTPLARLHQEPRPTVDFSPYFPGSAETK